MAGLVAIKGYCSVIHGTDFIGRISGSIRDHFRSVAGLIPGTGGALIPGLVLGDTSLETPGFIMQMRRVGLTHLTAVSGENFAIIAAFMLWLMQWIIPRLRVRLILTGIILILFINLVRPSPSVLRASIMTAVLLFAKARGEKSSALPALGLAITVLILVDPFQAIDPGFALSVGATAGILLIAPRLPIPQFLAIPLSATLICTPIIIAISGQLSLISIPANVLSALVIAPITIVGFIAAISAPVAPAISRILLLMVAPLSSWIAGVAQRLSSFPVLKLPKSFIGAGLVLICLILLLRNSWRTLLSFLVLILVAQLISHSQWPGSAWIAVNCDVGQGDGMVVNLGAHSAIVIDTGPDPALMDACLRSLGVNEIPLLVLTHFHADHVGGLSGIINRPIGQVWETNNGAPQFEFDQTNRLLVGIPTSVVKQGESITFPAPVGKISLDVLWPRESVESFASLPGAGSAINNSSIALIITINGIKIYTAGDIEPPVQQTLVESGLLTNVDLMKVSHHGSAYQYLPLLAALHPTFAFISVGIGNPYGHPSLLTINSLLKSGIKVFRTDLDGGIAISGGRPFRIRLAKKEWWQISWG